MNTARRAGATSLATLAACVVAFVALHGFAPQWAQSAGLDFWRMPEAVEHQRREQERERDIDDQSEELGLQIAAGDTVAAAVIEDRLGFEEAVDQIAEINRDRPGFHEALRAQYRPISVDRDLIARYLLDKVESRLENDPSRRCDVMSRITSR